MTVSQLQNHKWPVVSLKNGAGSARKDLASQIEWLSTFEEVVLLFDMDEPGLEAVKRSVDLFKPGKVKIATLPLKDANEMLLAGRGDEVIQAIWQASSYRPDGILSFSDVKTMAKKPVELGLPWFSKTLTDMTYGRRKSEVYAFGAGTGIGKTDFLTQQVGFDVIELNLKVGLFFLEQSPAETAQRIAGKLDGKVYHVPDAGWTAEELSDSLDRLDTGNLFLYDNFGSVDWEVVSSTIRHLVHSEGVEIIYLDHLTALAAAADDERKALEKIMAEIAMLAKELNIIMVIVSHLSTPEGKPHEEGGRVMIKHFKGSRTIGYWCYFMFGLERDQQANDPLMRTITTFRILKDRYTGRSTGKTIHFGFDVDRGLLFETTTSPETHGFGDESNQPAF
jgi:twinkle protein